MKKSDNNRQKMTLLLDSETITLLKQYGFDKFGATNVSKAVMSMAKDYGKQREQQNNS